MRYAMRTDIGRVRDTNEDSALALPKQGVYMVADGMGGHNAGEVASGLAIESMKNRVTGKKPTPDTLMALIQETNLTLLRRAQSDEKTSGMGTTLTMLWQSGNDALIGHVGDSRCYLLRGGDLSQLTADHSVVAELVQQGILTPEEARVHPYRNVVTRALGTAGYVEVDVLAVDIHPGDRFLLCSDGLSGMIGDEDIAKIMARHDIDAAANALIDAALKAGGRDNITLILCEADKEVSA